MRGSSRHFAWVADLNNQEGHRREAIENSELVCGGDLETEEFDRKLTMGEFQRKHRWKSRKAGGYGIKDIVFRLKWRTTEG